MKSLRTLDAKCNTSDAKKNDNDKTQQRRKTTIGDEKSQHNGHCLQE